jgi:ABC-type phosphate transport system substrate-binding protein
MRARFFVLVIAILALSATVLAQPSPPYRVIVNPKNAATSVDRKFLEDVFLKKVAAWPGGEDARPVDLPASSATRRAFTIDVLGRSIEEVRRYWQQRIFSGRDVPPPERSTDDEIVKYVLEHEGGVGYVSSGASLGGAHVLAIR